MTVLAGIAAAIAHLVAGGAIESFLGLFMGVVGAALISMIALYRPGFVRTTLAMLAGQFSFHLFFGIGGPSGHHHVVEPLVSGSAVPAMGIAHTVAALLVAIIVSSAEHALRAALWCARALARPARALRIVVDKWAPKPLLPLGGYSSLAAVAGVRPLGSLGLRGPPVWS